MISDLTLYKQIGQKLVALNQLERAQHEPSGKLTASMLGWPTQWQVLKVLGVPMKSPDEYTLGKFLRGKHVEDWLVGEMPNVLKRQMYCEYNGVIGYADAVIKHNGEVPVIQNLTIPHEVKSVTNMKFKRIIGTPSKPGIGADLSHRWQACMYALALKSKWYAIDYVATDDYRIQTYLYEVNGERQEIDEIITEFNKWVSQKRVPEFKPRFDWQKSETYNNYPEWMNLNQEELDQKIRDYVVH